MRSKAFSKITYSIVMIMLFFGLIVGTASAEIGANGGTTTLKSDIEMMSGIPVHGGGHFTWTVTGPAAGELRTAIIERYDGYFGNIFLDGMLDEKEVEQYRIELERYLEDEQYGHEYMGANMRKFAPLNKKVKDYSEGLLGASNATTGKIVIKFYFNAWMDDAGDDEFELTDTTIPSAIYFPLNETFSGTYEIEHTEYMINVADYTDIDVDKGTFYLIRTPFGEIYFYSVSFKASENPHEKLTYQPWDWLEAPLVLFIVLIVFGYFVVTIPGRFRRYDVMKVVKVHTFVKVLLLILILMYLFAAFGSFFIGGLYLIITCVVFLFVSLVVSKTIYENAKRITTLPEKPDTAPKDQVPEEEVPQAVGRTVQCTTCGEIFKQSDDGYALGSTPCPACGSIGAVEFGTEENIPPPPDDLDGIS